MRIATLLCAACFLGTPILHAAAHTDPDTAELSTTFAVASPTKVPGKTLKPGTYSIKVVDHMSDRVILEIDGPKGKAEAKFIGLESSGLRAASGNGPIAYGVTHGEGALRGFAFPGGATAEFVYPKEDAVAIAKSASTQVPAIDPQSEGRPPAKNLSKDDLQMVTLWVLSPTRVGPSDASQPAIQAVRYQQPTPAPVQQKRAQTFTAPPSPQVLAQNTSIATPVPKPRPARVKPPVMLASLPHTASEEPLIFLAGLLLLLAAGVTRLVRVSVRVR